MNAAATAEAALLAAACADPSALPVLADCLLDRGDDAGAEGARWLYAKGRRPLPAGGEGETCRWYNYTLPAAPGNDLSELPGDMLDAIGAESWSHGHAASARLPRAEALAAVLDAFRRATPGRRAAWRAWTPGQGGQL